MRYHLAGDSTVASGRPAEHPMAGWGGELHTYVDAIVRNHAFGGATTESFLATGTWDELLRDVRPSDLVVIQFGHNDEKEPELLGARTGFTDRLRRMVADVREQGAAAVLCTSPARRWFAGERVSPTHGDYPNAVRDLAHALNAPLIDLTVFTTWLYEDLGPLYSRALLCHFGEGEFPSWPDGLEDDTHFRVEGARKIAGFVATSLRAIAREEGDEPPRWRSA